MRTLSPDVLYEDNHLLVIVKPAGMLAQADHTGDLDVVTWSKAYIKEAYNKPGNVYVGLVHRIDRPASGVMVVARTSKAAARLVQQFKQRTPQKHYLALVEGKLAGSGTQIDYLRKRDRRVEVVPPHAKGAKEARLTWRAVHTQDGLTLVDIHLETGRPHQVRVQMATLGTPLLGDFRYGARRELDGRNLALHCYRLELTHPTRKQPIAWNAHPPDTWPPLMRAAAADLI